MTQDHDLELPLTAPAREHANDAAQEPIQQTHQHDAQSEPITSTAAPPESNFFTPQAELPREQYDRGKQDGLRGDLPLSPWSPPASEWKQPEREAYLTGFRNGRAQRSGKRTQR